MTSATQEPQGRDGPEKHPAANAWIAVVRAYNHCSSAITRRISKFGMNLTQHEILINLLMQPGLSQQELAARCFSAKSGISALVTRFEADGLLHRNLNSEDARKKELFLTGPGKEQALRNLAIQNEIVDAMTSVYSKEELAWLEECMNRTTELLKQMD